MDDELDYGSEFEDEVLDSGPEPSLADVTIASTSSQPKVPNKAMQRLQEILANKTITPKPQTEEREIDLSVFDDDDDKPTKTSQPSTPKAVRRPSNNVDEWFAKRAMKTPPSAQRKMKLKDLKKSLETRLTAERKEGIELRREVFNADNEIFEEKESEEEEEELTDSETEEDSQKFRPDVDDKNPDNLSVDGDDKTENIEKEPSSHASDDDIDSADDADNDDDEDSNSDAFIDDKASEADDESEVASEVGDAKDPKMDDEGSRQSGVQVDDEATKDSDFSTLASSSRPQGRRANIVDSSDDEITPHNSSAVRTNDDVEDDEDKENAAPSAPLGEEIAVIEEDFNSDDDDDDIFPRNTSRRAHDTIVSDEEEELPAENSESSPPKPNVEFDSILFGEDDGEDGGDKSEYIANEPSSHASNAEIGSADDADDDDDITFHRNTSRGVHDTFVSDVEEELPAENSGTPANKPKDFDDDFNSDDDDNDITFHRNTSKRAHDTIVSDDEEELAVESSEPPAKKPNIDFDDIFAEDDGEDRIDMGPSDPFAIQHARRLIIDDDDDEEEEVKRPQRVKSPVLVDSTRYALDEDGHRIHGIGNANDNEKSGGFVEEEAALSGSDDGDSDDEEDDNDDYELELGDLDNLPDDEQIRSELIKTHLKLEKRKDDDKLVKLKAQFGDVLNTTEQWDRSFRARMHKLKDVDYSKLLGDPADGIPEDDDDDDEEITFKEHLERKGAEEKDSQQTKLYSLALNADEEFIDKTENTRDPKSNPNGMAKFIVENFHFQPK